ncbi:MAG: hypothetical protein HOW73_34190 [Polyangiaceae bacterium]|nr:hypothetical protein [Polyangiaceae bacterium]
MSQKLGGDRMRVNDATAATATETVQPARMTLQVAAHVRAHARGTQRQARRRRAATAAERE